MRAVQIQGYGGVEVLELTELPSPTLGAKDVRIEVHAAAVNPVDTKIRRGVQRLVNPLSFPWVLGLDASGVVTEVGSSVQGFELGDAVFTSPSHRRWGTYADEIVVSAHEVAPKPASLSHLEAASLPLVALTAWQGLVRTATIGAEQRVLIQAGAGGVGSIAIQIAKHFGATVLTTCSARNTELCRSLGADEVIDYQKDDFAVVASELDVVFDSLGGDPRSSSFQTLKPGGWLVTIDGGLPRNVARYGALGGTLATGLEMLGFKLRGWREGVRTANLLRSPSGEDLAQIAALCDTGALRPLIDRVYPLQDIQEAHAYSETRRARGKIVLQVR